MKIGEVASQLNIQTSAIRYYESIGLIPEPPRESGRRVYEADVIERLQFIQVAKQAGWSLDEIKTMVDSQAAGGHYSSQWREMAERKLAELDQLIAQVESMKSLIHRGLDCNCTSASDCALTDSRL